MRGFVGRVELGVVVAASARSFCGALRAWSASRRVASRPPSRDRTCRLRQVLRPARGRREEAGGGPAAHPAAAAPESAVSDTFTLHAGCIRRAAGLAALRRGVAARSGAAPPPPCESAPDLRRRDGAQSGASCPPPPAAAAALRTCLSTQWYLPAAVCFLAPLSGCQAHMRSAGVAACS